MIPAQLPRLGGGLGLAGGLLGTWFVIERTGSGRSYLRAGTENPALVQAFGINVPLMVMPLTWRLRRRLAASPACWPRRSSRSRR